MPMQTLSITLPCAGENPAPLSAKVRCSFTPTTLVVELNTDPGHCPAVADFKHVLTAAAPGNLVDSLTWTALNHYQFRYKHQVQQTASTPWPPMEICYPALGSTIATLMFDRLECGRPCAVEDTATGKLYTRMRVLNNDDTLGEETELAFTSGTVLLVD